jgi:hypothetical protein
MKPLAISDAIRAAFGVSKRSVAFLEYIGMSIAPVSTIPGTYGPAVTVAGAMSDMAHQTGRLADALERIAVALESRQ